METWGNLSDDVEVSILIARLHGFLWIGIRHRISDRDRDEQLVPFKLQSADNSGVIWA